MSTDLQQKLHFTSISLQLLHKLCDVYQKRGLFVNPNRNENGNSAVVGSSEEIATAERFKQWLLSHQSTSSIEPTLITLIRGYSAATVFLVKELLHNQLNELQAEAQRRMHSANKVTASMNAQPEPLTEPQRQTFYGKSQSRFVLFQRSTQPSQARHAATTAKEEAHFDDLEMTSSLGLGAGA